MKMLICIPQLVKGGAERVVCNLSNYFIEKNEVTLVSLRNYPAEYDIDKKIELLYLDKNINQNKFIKLINRIIKLKKIIKEKKPELILCFLPEASFVTLFLRKFYKGKIVISIRNDPKQEYKNPLKYLLMKILYPLADGIVFQTKDAQRFFSKRIKDKSKIIPNSLNPNFIVPKYNGERKKKIVAVGRLVNQKNHKLLIRAFSRFCEINDDYNLYIYGDGKLKTELMDYITELDLENRVFLPGVVDDIKNKIYDASLYVLSSNYEGMPNSLMEALALGIPCIATNCPCGGPAMLIKNGYNGILIDVNDENALTEKIKELLLNKEMSEKLAERANIEMKKYNPDIINNEWNEFLINIKNDRG